MLDSHLHPRLKPLLNAVAGVLDRPGISPDGLTLVGFAIGAGSRTRAAFSILRWIFSFTPWCRSALFWRIR